VSYVHEYCLPGGKKSLLEFSRPFSLARFAPARWVVAPEDLHWLMDKLDEAPHVPVAPPRVRRRRSSKIELRAQEVVEWPDPRKRKLKRKRKAR
jgi:hypothetical protein